MIEILTIVLVLGSVGFFFLREERTEEATWRTDILFSYNEKESKLLDLINNHRNSLGLSILKTNDYTSFECLKHNQDMLELGKVSHFNFVNRSERIKQALKVKAVGENIAYNFKTPEATLKAWLNSEEHKENVENTKWMEMGISCFDKYSTNIFIK
jgi:uncharacterized protein YkwD